MKAFVHGANGWVVAVVVALLTVTVQAGTIYVSKSGNDANDGLGWATAKATVQAGLSAAASGDQVWVAAGTYVERITLPAGLALYGGFSGNETDLVERNSAVNPTVLDGNQAGIVVTVASGATQGTRLDGFTVRNGKGSFGGGIHCNANASPVIANNRIVNNTSSSYGGGIYCYTSASPTITNNTISDNVDGGILCHASSSAVIANNTITGNTGSDYGGGIYCYQSASPTILNNRIVANQAMYGGGIYFSGTSVLIANNMVVGNYASQRGGGILCTSIATLINNTVAANAASSLGGGIYVSGSITMASTIVAFNSSGIYRSGSGSLVLKSNCVYGNGTPTYVGLSDPTGTNGNIAADPKLPGLLYGNVHLASDSPCVDTGDDSSIQADWTDLDGLTRIVGTHVDIGADEFDGTLWPSDPNVVVRVSPAGNDANDGSSWLLAKRTVQAGIDAAAAVGGDVWVAAGTYQERINLRNLVHVYGGFAGTETERSARDWSAHVSILDGNRAGTVVGAIGIGPQAGTIDGFVIRNGGSGITCRDASPVIANNTIAGNTSSVDCGGGIYCVRASPLITNNIITGNTALTNGGGIYCYDSGCPTIANNRITGNTAFSSGGGISLSSAATIINNTIVGNHAGTAGGISCGSSATVIANTIIAFNSSGVQVGGGTPSLRYNCVYGNFSYDYAGLTDPTGSDGNMSVDPGLAGELYSNLHIQPGSPCVDTGDDSLAQRNWVDMDGQPRKQGAHVDIGADESDGTVWPPVSSVIVRVSKQGNDANDGSSWPLAKRTVQAAVDTASPSGGQIWVAAGTYVENLVLPLEVAIYGGFAGTETDLSQRDWTANQTILDGNRADTVIRIDPGVSQATRVDGFVIRNGSGDAGGIYCPSSCLATIVNNTITANNGGYGGGVYCTGFASPTIRNNVITYNSATGGGGIYCYNSSPVIADNTIEGNNGCGVYCYQSSSPTISNNTIRGNTLNGGGGGIHCSNSSSPTIINNTIVGNSARGLTGAGGGIYCSSSSSPAITNNTVTGNNAADGGGIYCSNSSPTIANTVVAFNSSGIYGSGSTPSFRSNCIYGNGAYDLSGLTNPTGSSGNISLDPKLASVAYGNVHTQPDSPCVDAGDSTVVQVGWTDMDHQARLLGSGVDIGADETDGTVWAQGPYSIVRISSQGSDSNDGSSWSLAKRTVQAGIDAAAATGGEVWVQSGTYRERVTLRNLAYLYGGFAGTETDRSARVAAAGACILDGAQAGSVVTATGLGYALSAIDGFTIRNGSGNVSNRVSYGGGIYCDGASPMITNNTIIGNSASANGGGLYCAYSSAPIVANNTIAGNDSPQGGGIYCSFASPRVINTIIAFNSSGFCLDGTRTPSLRHNCVYGNRTYNYSGLSDPTGSSGNISTDPYVAAVEYGNAHIQPGSPCIDAGDDGVVQPSGLDVDGQPRKQGAHVDIGADESDGASWPDSPNVVVRVAPDGNDANDGSSWSQAKRTVQAGIDAAGPLGGEVWVKQGTYAERVTLRGFAHLYGGFAGTETERSARDWSGHLTILDGGQAGSVVTAACGYQISTIDGFTIRNGNGTASGTERNGGGIYCYCSSPRIANNTITGNAVSTYGGGIHAYYSSPHIVGNAIIGNTASSYGGGIYCYYGSPLIVGNTLSRNVSSSLGGAISSFYSSMLIEDNTVRGNKGSSGAGIYCYSGSQTIANNTIVGNTATSGGGGIFCSNASPSIVNNTIVSNSATTNGGGIYWYSSSGTLANCVVASNSSGIYKSGNTLSLWSNCVYSNTAYNFSGLTDPTGINGNISGEPFFVQVASAGSDGIWGTADDVGDLHLLPGSPCIDAGSNADVPADAADLDGDGNTTEPLPIDLAGAPRFDDDPYAIDTGSGTVPIVDMGAYEHRLADANGDGYVDVVDLLGVVYAFGTAAGDPNYDAACDFNHDGAVDVVDLLDLVYNFGT